MTRQEAKNWILSRGGKFFSVVFIKRGDGSLRAMCCRRGVKKHLKGFSPSYSFKDHGLISVWDCCKREYRVIPIEGLRKVKVNGKWRRVTA